MNLSKKNVLFMAAATGLIVANLYYCQPLIILIAKEFNIPKDGNNNVSNASWLCYRFVLMVPLGDKIERKSQIPPLLLL
jgi:hypothetical protein